jgi:transcriptional regulator with XRE-family HTH domain
MGSVNSDGVGIDGANLGRVGRVGRVDPGSVDQAGRPDRRPERRFAPSGGREPLWRDLVGAVLREERRTQERTLQDVADAAMISMPYLSELERGRKEASSEVLAAAARALGLRLSDLILQAQLLLLAHEEAISPARSSAIARAAAAAAAHATISARASSARAATGVSRRDALCLAA